MKPIDQTIEEQTKKHNISDKDKESIARELSFLLLKRRMANFFVFKYICLVFAWVWGIVNYLHPSTTSTIIMFIMSGLFILTFVLEDKTVIL